METDHPITRYRVAVGMSQATLASRVDCGRSMMNLIEKGLRQPSPELAGRISKATGIPVVRLRPDLAALFSEPAQ